MQTTWSKLTSPVRSLTAGTWCALSAVLVVCLCLAAPAVAGASAPPIVVSGTPVQLGALTGGGWDGSQEPIGGTFVVGADGSVLVGNGYGSNFLQLTLAGSDTILAAGVGGSAATLDKYGNLYLAGNYNTNVYKVPFVSGAYVGWSGSAPTTACQGGNNDQTACVFAPAISTFVGTLGTGGFAGLAFDAAGNFFFETNTLPTTDPDTIFECNTSCLANPSATPSLLYSDPAPVGAMQIDPWGNIFFVDGNNAKGKATNLNELPAGSYTSAPKVVLSYTNQAGYGNGISGLAMAGTGTIYFSTNGDGLFAIPNTQSGGPNVGGMYMVATQGGKGVAIDAKGNLYAIPYNNGDVVSYIPVNNFGLGAEPVGTAATAVSATILDSSGSCTPALTAAATQFGVASTEFTATADPTTCAAAFGGSNGTFSTGPLTAAGFSAISVSLKFTPSAAGERNAALVLNDSTNSAVGMAALFGVGQAAAANVDPGVTTTYNTGLTNPASIVADAAGDVFIADSGAGKVYEIAAGMSTLTPIGSGFMAPNALAFDANGDLFVADDGLMEVVEIPNTGTTGAFAAGTQTTLVSSTELFGGQALGSTAGLAIGPKGTLYISDPQNNRVVYYDLINSQSGVTLATKANGLSAPAGLAVEAGGKLYVADSGTNKIVELAAGVISTISSSSISQAIGVAVDGSGSLLIADGASGNIVRIPTKSGVLSTADAVTVETLASPASSLWANAAGTLYVAGGNAKSAYAINRTSASINLGTVADGATGTGTIYLMNAGNEAATLSSPALSQPTNTMFLLAPAGTNGCTDGGSGPAGSACAITATFAPPAGSNDSGPYSDSTGAILVSSPSLSIPVTIAGTASVSALEPQTITYNPAPPAAGFVGQQITLTASATSGLTVALADTTPGVCSLTGTTLTFLTAGTCTITANQAGGSNNSKVWGAAAQVTTRITVTSATPAGVPGLLVNQQAWLGSFPSGGAFAGDDPAGTSFGVNAKGQVVVGTSYGNTVLMYDPATATLAALGSKWSTQSGGAAVDASGNLYVSGLYSPFVAKIPYVNGAYAVTDPSASPAPPNCAGNDTAECMIAALTNNASIGGVASMAFDAQGNLFVASDDKGSNPFAIYECSVACQNTGTPTPVLLFQEPTGVNPATTGQLYIGSLAVDPWGNLFFTDSNFINQTSSYNNKSTYSDLNYLPTSTGAGFGGATTGYAATPTVLETFTDAKPGGYDDEIDSVVVAPNGTVYYAYQYDGIYAVPNTQTGGPDGTHQFVVSGQGAKEIALDAQGNIYYVSYNNGGDALGVIWQGNLTTPNAQYLGAPVNASATVVDNAITCNSSTPAALAFAFSGTNASDFSGAQGTGCSSIAVSSGNGTLTTSINTASSYPATITFTPLNPNTQTATIAVSDTANGGVGSAMVTAVAQTTPQSIAFTAPTTTTYTYMAPPNPVTIALTVANGPSNNPVVFSVDAKSTGAGTISASAVSGTNSSAMLTVTQAGTIIVDANEVGGLVNGVYYQDAPQVQLTLTIGQATQTIAFTPVAGSPFTYAPAPNQLTLQLSATGGSSNNPVTFTVDPSSTGAGTISSTSVVGNASLATLTITQAGSIVLDANQAGNVNYAAATQEQQSIQVNQASQTITYVPPTQPVYFIAKSTGIGGGITVSVSAVGGGSNNPIVFTVDKTSTMSGVFGASMVSGATSTAILTIPLQGNVTSGNIVIDATQPASANYAAVTVAPLATLTILPPLPLQTITWGNPGTQVNGATLALTGTASSGFPVIYTSSTTAVCTVNNANVTFVTAGTCTIAATQPGDNIHFAAAPPVTQTFTVNAKGLNPNMSLNLSLSSLILQSGTVGTSTITVTSQNNFTGAIAFTCSGLPSGYACTFTPNPLNLQANQSAGVTLAISPTGTASLERGARPFAPLAALAGVLILFGIRKRNRIFLVVLLTLSVVGVSLFTGCGGSSTKAIQSTTNSVTVTAAASGMSGASGSVTQAATVSVTIQ